MKELPIMKEPHNINELLEKPLWQMTGEEYVALHAYACTINNGESTGRQTLVQCKGVHELAEYCSCSESQVFKLLRESVLDEAILSSIGKSTVFDGEKARELAQTYLVKLRMEKKKRNA